MLLDTWVYCTDYGARTDDFALALYAIFKKDHK